MWDRYRSGKVTDKETPYEQNMLEANPVKTMTKPQKKKTEKDQIT